MAGPSLPYDPTYHLLFRVDKIRAWIRRQSPDVLEIDSPYVAAIAALGVDRQHMGVRTLFWHSDFIDTYVRQWFTSRWLRPLSDGVAAPLWRYVRWITSGCDAVFVASLWQARKLAEHGVERLCTVPFGIERTHFSSAARSLSRRRELLACGDDLLLVGAGRFAVEKRWDVVLDAFAEVRRRRAATLVLFGDGPERPAMERRAREIGHVHFAGFERDRALFASALASADALVHGCPYETFGLSVAEAMASGLPVVVPDEGGASELMDPACGELYRSGDSVGCAAAIERLLGRDPTGLRDAALRASGRIPSVQDHFAAVLGHYGELLARRVADGAAPRRGRPPQKC